MRHVRVPGDGSCFFHSVGFHVGRRAQELRQLCVNELERRQDEVIEGLPLKDWVKHELGVPMSNYIQAMARGQWGGAVEMRLLADYFRRPIVVYKRTGGAQAERLTVVWPLKVPDDECPASQEPIFLLYVSGVHYDALRPLEIRPTL